MGSQGILQRPSPHAGEGHVVECRSVGFDDVVYLVAGEGHEAGPGIESAIVNQAAANRVRARVSVYSCTCLDDEVAYGHGTARLIGHAVPHQQVRSCWGIEIASRAAEQDIGVCQDPLGRKERLVGDWPGVLVARDYGVAK